MNTDSPFATEIFLDFLSISPSTCACLTLGPIRKKWRHKKRKQCIASECSQWNADNIKTQLNQY